MTRLSLRNLGKKMLATKVAELEASTASLSTDHFKTWLPRIGCIVMFVPNCIPAPVRLSHCIRLYRVVVLVVISNVMATEP